MELLAVIALICGSMALNKVLARKNQQIKTLESKIQLYQACSPSYKAVMLDLMEYATDNRGTFKGSSAIKAAKIIENLPVVERARMDPNNLLNGDRV